MKETKISSLTRKSRRSMINNDSTEIKQQNFDFAVVDTKLVWFSFDQKMIWHFEIEQIEQA